MSLACAGQQAASPTAPTPSPRVSTHLKAITLQAALKEVSRLTGVPLSASEDTADLKVTLLVKDLSLDTLRERLAEALHLTWMPQEATKEKPVSYLIYRSTKNREEEAELMERGERAFRKGVDEAIGVLSMPAKARAELFIKRPALEATFAQNGGEAAVTFLSKMSPEMRTRIMDGYRVEFSSSKPPPEYTSFFKEMMTYLKAAAPNPIIARILGEEGKFSVMRNGEGAAAVIGIAFSVNNEAVSGSTGYAVRGVHAGEVYPEFYAPDHIGPVYADALRPITVPTRLAEVDLEDAMEKVADTLHLNIIGESYSQSIMRDQKGEILYHTVEAGTSTLSQVMDDIVWHNRWWKHGDVYLFQTPQWWVVRRSQISDAKLASLTKLVSTRPLSFDTMAQIGKTLSVDQAPWLNKATNGGDVFLLHVQAAMRFYGHLSDANQQALFLKEGVDVSVLTDADRQRLRTWIKETDAQALQEAENTPGSIHIFARRLGNSIFDPAKSDRVPENANRERVLFRVVFQAKDGTKHLLRDQIIADGYVDPQDPQLHTPL